MKEGAPRENQWKVERDQRHMDNMKRFTGLYQGKRYVNGIGAFPRTPNGRGATSRGRRI